MTLADIPLWLRSLLGVAGLAAGMAAHLALHPQRRHFSDAFDLLKSRPYVLLIGGVLLLAQKLAGSDGLHSLPDARATDWADWTGLAGSLTMQALTRFALLPHQVLAAWPAALLLPALLTVTLIHLARQPYRAGLRQKPRGGEFALLAALTLLFFIATAMETLIPPASLAEWQVNLLLFLRLAAVALFNAGIQIWLLRVTVRWLLPPPRRGARPAGNAWWELLGRWQVVLALGAFNLLWVALRFWLAVSSSSILPWLLVEWLLVFSALPVAIALTMPGGDFFQAGAHGLRLLGRSLAPWFGIGLTAVVILALALYADGVATTIPLTAPAVRFAVAAVSSFALAFIHIWLFLAVALMLLRRSSTIPPDSSMSRLPE